MTTTTLNFSPVLPQGTTANLRASAVSVTLPLPPSVNALYCTVFKRRVLSAEGKKFKRFVGKRLPALLPHLEPHEWLRLELTFHLPLYYQNGKRRKWDATNYVKVLEDAIVEALCEDDSAVLTVSIAKSESPDRFVVATVGVAPAQGATKGEEK